MNKYNEVAITLYYENEAPPTENLRNAWEDGRDLVNSQPGTIMRSMGRYCYAR